MEEWTNTAQIGKHSLDGSYVPFSGYRFVGIKTDFVVGSVVPSCTVTLRDSSGLESTTDVSTTTTKLTEIYVDPTTGNDSYPGSDLLPVATVGKAMEKLSGMTNTTIILVGDINVQNTLAFTASYPNITLKGGVTPVTLTYSGTGRAITVSGGKLTLGENAPGGGPGMGGGVQVGGGTFTMTDGTISGNKVWEGAGGGIYFGGSESTFTVSGGNILGQGNKKEIYSEKTFAMTGSPTITDCAITLEQGAHIDVQGLSTDAALTNLQISPTTYTAGEALLEHATDIAICKKFGLYSPPADGIW